MIATLSAVRTRRGAVLFAAWDAAGGNESKAEIDDYAARLAQHGCQLTKKSNRWVVTYFNGDVQEFAALGMMDIDPNTSAMVSW